MPTRKRLKAQGARVPKSPPSTDESSTDEGDEAGDGSDEGGDMADGGLINSRRMKIMATAGVDFGVVVVVH